MNMKKITMALGVWVLASSSLAWSQDSFDMTQNGRTYRCTAISAAPGTGAAACASRAYQGPFSREQSVTLCAGAGSTAPAECAISAYQGPFNQDQAIALCSGALSSAPSDCAKRAYQGPFNQDQSVRLCKRNGTVATAECAIRAYSGPYNQEEAINLCRSSQLPLIERALNAMLGDDGSNPELNLKRSFEKSLR